MSCDACGKESAIDFSFCPRCGLPARAKTSVSESADNGTTVRREVAAEVGRPAVTPSSIKAGTIVFGIFAAISLLVSIAKGVVPIFLIESGGWVGLAWFWQAKRTHSDFVRGVVTILAVIVSIGEVLHIAIHSGPDSVPGSAVIEGRPTVNPAPVYENQSPAAPAPSVPTSDSKRASATDAKYKQSPDPVSLSKLNDEAVWRMASDRFFDKHESKEAAPFLDESCKRGNARACEVLGSIYEYGSGVAGDSSRAAALYSRMVTLYATACDKGSRDGCSGLRSIYHSEGQEPDWYLPDDKRDIPREIVLFTTACDAHSAEGCRYLGDLYWKGEDVVQDRAEAVALYTKSCDANDADGCADLADGYKLGLGVEKDAARAVEFLTKGCNLGAQRACDQVKEPQ